MAQPLLVNFEIAGNYSQIETAAKNLSTVFEEYGFIPNPKVKWVDTSEYTAEQVRDPSKSPPVIAHLGATRKAREIQHSYHSKMTIGDMIVVEHEGRVLTNVDVYRLPDLSGADVWVYLSVCLMTKACGTLSAPVLGRKFKLRIFAKGELEEILRNDEGRASIPASNPFSTRLNRLVMRPAVLDAFLIGGFETSVNEILPAWKKKSTRVGMVTL